MQAPWIPMHVNHNQAEAASSGAKVLGESPPGAIPSKNFTTNFQMMIRRVKNIIDTKGIRESGKGGLSL